MKLVLVTPHFAPHFEGGTELVARAQAREFARLGHEVRVVSGTDRRYGGEDVLRETVEGIPVAFLPRLPSEPYDLELERPRVSRLVHELVGEADVVHVHHWSTLTGTLVRDLSRERPVVLTLHDLFATCPRFFRVPVRPVERCPQRGDFVPCARCVAVDAPGIPLAELERRLRARALRFQAELDAAARIVVPSRSHAENLGRFVDLAPTKLVVVPHGLARAFDRRGALRWTGEGKLRVLFLGHRSAVKGVGDLVRALAALPADRVELLCLGAEVERGFDAELLREARDLRLELGAAYEPTDLASRLEARGGAHLAALPSQVEESYGLVTDEALALGLPVWVSDRGAPKERVGAAGRVLPAGDPAAWTQAFREVLASPDKLEAERTRVPRRVRTAAEAARELLAVFERLVPAP